MAVTFHKPSKLKYTDMAIYIDAHLSDIVEADKNPKVEQTIFEYIYHIIFALSYKAGFFKNLNYYDDFALYGASELFVSMRKKLLNSGKLVRGKPVVPVKSSLNYIKSVLFPLKVNYQRQFFHTVINPDLIDQDTRRLEYDLKSSIMDQYTTNKEEAYEDAIKEMPKAIRDIVNETPFRCDPSMYKKIYISVLLTLINYITLPGKVSNKLVKKATTDSKTLEKYFEAYQENMNTVLLWHLDDAWSNYIRILVTKVKKEFSKKVSYYLHFDDLSEEDLDNIMKSAFATYEDRDNETGD